MIVSNAPRQYSRMETDDELTARLRDAYGSRFSRAPYESLDDFADRLKLQRKIIWVTP